MKRALCPLARPLAARRNLWFRARCVWLSATTFAPKGRTR
jgi:hypothetical protein